MKCSILNRRGAVTSEIGTIKAQNVYRIGGWNVLNSVVALTSILPATECGLHIFYLYFEISFPYSVQNN